MGNITLSQALDDINLYLYPNASVSTALTAVGQVENYQCVDEVWSSPNSDTDYVYSSVTDSVATDFYGLPNHTTETGTINYVRVVAVVSSGSFDQSSSGTYRLLLQDVGTSVVSYGVNRAPITIGYKKYYETFTSRPSGGGWTWPDIDNLNVGLDLSSPTFSVPGELTLRPDGNQYNQGWTVVGAANIAAAIDEADADDDATYVRRYSSSETPFVCTAQDHTTETGTINYVDIIWRGRNTGTYGSNQQRSRVALSTTTLTGTFRTPQKGVYNNYADRYSTKPGGGAWTWTDIDNMHIGASTRYYTSNEYTYITQLYAIVNYDAEPHPDIKTTQIYAIVNYTPAVSTITLTIPENLNVGHSRNIERFNFPAGDYEVADYGRSGKTLTITGWETSSATIKMQSIKNMAHYGSSISLTGMPDTNLNTDYMIRNFSWTEEGGYAERFYNWTLELEEV